MKAYGATVKDYGDTGCCPGHDNPVIRKWSGTYKNDHKSRAKSKSLQNRKRRRTDKYSLVQEFYENKIRGLKE